MKTIWLFIPVMAMFLSCHSNTETAEGPYNDEVSYKQMEELENEPVFYANATTDGSFASGGGKLSQPKAPTIKMPDKIIKTGFVEMELDNYAKAMTDIAARVQAAQGYISNQNEQRDSYRIMNTLTIRVVNQNFDGLMNSLGDLAKKVVRKSESMQDVTEEYTDIAARLKTKREVEARYLDILKSAKTIKDVLALEEQLRVIREEIESSEARLKFLDDRVSYSTITLQVYEELEYNVPAPLQAGFGQKMLAAITNGWNALLAMAIGLVSIWPLLLGGTVVVIVAVRRFRRSRAVA